jgi:hypothetical protein
MTQIPGTTKRDACVAVPSSFRRVVSGPALDCCGVVAGTSFPNKVDRAAIPVRESLSEGSVLVDELDLFYLKTEFDQSN